MSESLLSHFTKKQSEGFAHFHERISLSLTKHEQFAQKHLYFFVFFFMPKTNRSCHSLQKSDCHSLQKSNVRVSLFLTSECFFALSLTKNEQFARNTMSEFPTLVFEPNQRNLAFPQLYPWQTTCKCIKFEKA